jgi:hypothetical protein
MKKPILYSKDKIAIGKREGFFHLGFEEKLSLDLNNSFPVSYEYQKLFNKIE